jgi:hypothetical protein
VIAQACLQESITACVAPARPRELATIERERCLHDLVDGSSLQPHGRLERGVQVGR